jgi:hypothetical protein
MAVRRKDSLGSGEAPPQELGSVGDHPASDTLGLE